MYKSSVRPTRSAQRKRGPTQTALPFPSKRLKTGIPIGLSGPALPHSPSRPARAERGRAEDWFDDTNKNASAGAPFPDNDPPFYIRRQPSSDGNSVCAVRSDGSSPKHSALGMPTAPTRSLLARMISSESNSEDFRSVIDDLTIQNKKLKKKLRLYEKLHCSHLEQDKLFEVRIYGLAGHRKRELEQKLRSFASSIDEYSPQRPILKREPSKYPSAASEPLTSLQTTATGAFPSSESIAAMRKSSSASTSCSKPVDSAYASMSGQTGTSQLQPVDKRRHDRLTQASQKHQSVRSYLHDIPETLVPKHTMAMSDRSKSKLVVRRLEQIFTGKGAAFRYHTQSHQQQEVSHSAAQADQTRGRRLHKEGVRQARILPIDADLQVDSLSEANLNAQRSRQSSHDGRGTQGSRDQSLEQRPTRPLDLDLHRAQVPADNIDYIRHLGLSSPTASTESNSNEGWVYLNLLTSMAQLHTLNVTPKFIRHAIADVGSNFKLSNDGAKVRWLGGTEGTKMSSDSDSSSDMSKSRPTNFDNHTSKRGSSSNMSRIMTLQEQQEPNTALPRSEYETSADAVLPTKRRPVVLDRQTNESAFQYKPLFFHGTSTEDSNDSEVITNSAPSSDLMENATGKNSGTNSGSHGMHETEARLRKQNTESGPIIFYHKARFCTDLSGDPSGAYFDESDYIRYTQDPIGSSADDLNKSKENGESQELEPMGLDVDSAQADRSTLDLEELKSCISDCFSSTSSANAAPVPMEVSGLGGVQPEDNFVVNVQVRHRNRRRKTSSIPPNQVHRAAKQLRSGLVEAVTAKRPIPRSQPMSMPVDSEIVSTTRTNLKPSSLPSPSYACLTFSSSGSEGEEDDDDSSVASENDLSRSTRKVVAQRAARPNDFFIGSSSDETKESSYASTSPDSGDDDDSIDLLAHARVLDPDTIAERERDFDNNFIPSGSLAATAGESSCAPMKTIPRTTTSDVDSMSVDGDDGSSKDDGECLYDSGSQVKQTSSRRRFIYKPA